MNDVAPSLPELRQLSLHGARSGAQRAPVAYFGAGSDAYKGAPLFVRDPAGLVFRVGTADPYVRPVWRPNMHALLYVRVRPGASFPGAHWSLVEFDLATRQSHVLTERNGMAMSPVGWSHGQILYSVATEASTDLYRITAGRPRFISILITQPITAPSLSPDGNTIAFDVPASCTYCTLDTFNLGDLTTWNGPSGALNERNLAWTDDGNTLVTVAGTALAAIDVRSHHMVQFAWPSGLPQSWSHPMRATVLGNRVRLTDENSLRSFLGRALTLLSR